MESQAYPAPKAQTVIQVETVAPDQEDLKEPRYDNDINANLQIVSKTNAFFIDCYSSCSLESTFIYT